MASASNPVRRHPLASGATEDTHCLPRLDYLGRLARDRSEEALRPFGLRPRHLLALTRLSDRGSVSQQDLGVELRLEPSNLVGLLNELEREGLISRQRSSVDRRRHVVELTVHGGVVLDDALRALRAVEDAVLQPLEGDQRALLAHLLGRIVGAGSPCAAATDPDLNPDRG